MKMPDDETRNWKEKGLALVVPAVGLLVLAGVAASTYLTWSAIPLHSNPQNVPSLTSAPPPHKWSAAVEQARQLARAGLVEQNLPGLSVAVGADGGIVWAEGFGWADLEKRVPVAPNTQFRIGHASNALTSAAAGLLLEQGRLRLDDEIQVYVPAFPQKEWPVTLRQLMGHVAGIRHYDSEKDYMPLTHCARAADGLAPFARDPLRFEPETRYSYSTFGWVLVSAAIEAQADEPFFSFMRKHVFEPAGMVDTTFDYPTDATPNLATFYYPRFSGDTHYGPELASTVDYSCFAGGGAFLSTPSDLVRFGLAIGSGKLLQSATVKRLQTPQLLTSGEETQYGLGWMLETVPLAGEPALLASHASRTLLGGSTSFMTFPERGMVVAVTSNISLANTRTIALKIAEAFAEGGRRSAAR
ncbi:MAG: serine hydrolase domain-containing protein [Vicinamibacterales bacterium]